MVKIAFQFDLKNFRYSHEYLKGVANPLDEQGQIQIAHAISNINYQILNDTEIKVSFHFQ